MVMKSTRLHLLYAGLGWISKPETKCINFENIHRQKLNGTEYKLIGFIIDGRAIPRNGYNLVDKYNNKIGRVTSGTSHLSLKRNRFGLH